MSDEGLTDSPSDFLDQAVSDLVSGSEAVETTDEGATGSNEDHPIEDGANAPEGEAVETAEPAQEADTSQEDQNPEEAVEAFTNRDPNSLPPELRAQYLSMQRDYTQKTQLIAPVVKAVKHNAETLSGIFEGAEEASPEDLAAAAVDHLAAMYSDPEVAQMHFNNLAQMFGFDVSGEEGFAPETSEDQAGADTPEISAFKEQIRALEDRLNERDAAEQQYAERAQFEAQVEQQAQELVSLFEATKEDPRFKHFNEDEWGLIATAALNEEQADFLGTAERYEQLVESRVKQFLQDKEAQPNIAAGGIGGPAVEPSSAPKSVADAGELAAEFLKQQLSS